MNVGDYIKYRNYHMTIIAINEKTNKVHALCYENHKVASFPIDDPEAIVVKPEGCKVSVKAIFDDLYAYTVYGR